MILWTSNLSGTVEQVNWNRTSSFAFSNLKLRKKKDNLREKRGKRERGKEREKRKRGKEEKRKRGKEEKRKREKSVNVDTLRSRVNREEVHSEIPSEKHLLFQYS